MVIARESWHYSLFKFGLKVINLFMGEYYTSYFENGTNLCHYMRVILVYLPLILLIWLATLAATVYVAVITPIKLFGISDYLWTLGIIAAVTVGIVLVSIMISLVFDGFLMSLIRRRRVRRLERIVAPELNFLELMGQWLVAKKQKVCPQLEFVKREAQ